MYIKAHQKQFCNYTTEVIAHFPSMLWSGEWSAPAHNILEQRWCYTKEWLSNDQWKTCSKAHTWHLNTSISLLFLWAEHQVGWVMLERWKQRVEGTWQASPGELHSGLRHRSPCTAAYPLRLRRPYLQQGLCAHFRVSEGGCSVGLSACCSLCTEPKAGLLAVDQDKVHWAGLPRSSSLLQQCQGCRTLPETLLATRANGVWRQPEPKQRGCPHLVDADGPGATTWTHQAESCSLVQYFKVRIDMYSNSGMTAAFYDLVYTLWDRVITSTG